MPMEHTIHAQLLIACTSNVCICCNMACHCHRGKYWSGIRAACEPLFHSQQLRTYAPVVNKAVDAMIAKLALLKPGQPVEINLALAGFTMDTIGAAVFG